jgi:hypothetical protein
LPLYDPQDQTVSKAEKLNMRERLRLWKPSNLSNDLQFSEMNNLRDRRIYDQLRPSTDSEVLDNQPIDRDSTQAIYGKGELVDFGGSRTFLLRGDLVELR